MATMSESASASRFAGGRMPMLVAVVLIVLLAVAYQFFYPIFIMKILCFAILAMAFNLLIGYVGLMSFGHALFFGGAGYMTAYAMKNWGFDPILAIALGVVFAAALGGFVGFVAIRRKGIYFAMITLAMAQMFYFICVQAPATGGEDGIQGVPRGVLLGIFNLSREPVIYSFVCAIFLATLLFVWRFVNSPVGNILKAIREHEPRAISLGYNVDRYKLAAFVISSALAGLGGSTKAIVFQLATLTDVSWKTSGEVVFMTLLGGIGTLFGPIVGAALVTILETMLATSSLPVPIVLGAIFVLCVMIFRRGIVGEIEARLFRQKN
jgi:branched-chain amino acid transport system permease protein